MAARADLAGILVKTGYGRGEMDYVLVDSQITNQVVLAILEHKEVRWVTARGTTSREAMPRLLTVAEALALPEPDQSWMDRPLPRSKFYRWIPETLLPRA